MARKAGVSVYATWHSREAAQVDAARDWLADRRLRSLAVTWKEDVRRWHPGQAWIWRAGGLGVFDPGINALSIVTKILPEPLHLSGSDLFIPENCETPIAAKLAFAHQGGAEVTVDLDFRQQGDQIWQIAIETDAGSMLLSEGGAKLSIDGVSRAETADDNSLTGEYPRLYAHMAELVRSGSIDMDLSPMVHVADAFLLGRRLTVEPFYE
jgi:D-galactose 1-dehydrogenase